MLAVLPDDIDPIRHRFACLRLVPPGWRRDRLGKLKDSKVTLIDHESRANFGRVELPSRIQRRIVSGLRPSRRAACGTVSIAAARYTTNFEEGPGSEVACGQSVAPENDIDPAQDEVHLGPRRFFPTRCVRTDRSSVTICRRWPPSLAAARSIWPSGGRCPVPRPSAWCWSAGSTRRCRSRSRLKASPWTTTMGRRYPASEPEGSGRSAHQTSPCRDRQSVRSRIRAAACSRNGSTALPTSDATRLSASVTSSGE